METPPQQNSEIALLEQEYIKYEPLVAGGVYACIHPALQPDLSRAGEGPGPTDRGQQGRPHQCTGTRGQCWYPSTLVVWVGKLIGGGETFFCPPAKAWGNICPGFVFKYSQ